MATGNLQLVGNTSGGPDGSRTFGPFTTLASTAIDETLLVALTVGANTITVPAGTTACAIIPPNWSAPGVPQPNPAYAGTLTLKGVGGDTGVVISAYAVTKLDWAGSNQGTPAPPASFVINASAGSANLTVWFM